MNKKLILFLIFSFIIFIILTSLQASLFDTFSIEPEKDIFLEYELDTTLQYNLFVIDSYNASSFGTKHNLEYAVVSVYRKDKKTAYPNSIFNSPFKEGGITTSEREAIASFKPVDSIVYIRIRGTSIKSAGSFGIALFSSKSKKMPFKLSKSIFAELHKEALIKNSLEQYKLLDGKAIKFTYNVEKGKEYTLTLVDSFNNSMFGTYFTLDGLWFHVLDENNNFYEGIYSSIAEDGGITSINSEISAKFIAKTSIVIILIEPLSLIYEGTFGIRFQKNNEILKPKSIAEAEPIGYESKIEEIFDEELINLDTIEITNKSIIIQFDTKIGKTYYIYLSDNYNAEIFNQTYTFKDLFFQIFDKDHILVSNCYASEVTSNEKVGGITILNNKPSASFEASKESYTIEISSLTNCISGTIGLIILDSDKNPIAYKILTK